VKVHDLHSHTCPVATTPRHGS